MYCQHCGAEIKEDDRFCAICGTPVQSGPREAQTRPVHTGSEKTSLREKTEPLVLRAQSGDVASFSKLYEL